MIDPFALNLRHLRAMQAIVEYGSMSASAKVVGISQPALTQGLAKLERQLGASLFHRRFDGVVPTTEGRLAAKRVAAAFVQLGGACRAITRMGPRGFSRPEQLVTATQLHAFLHVADRASYAAAAEATGLSQPSLHRAVRDLEQIVSAPLVGRRGRGIVVTDAGQRLIRGIRLARSELASAIVEIGEPAGTGGGLVIGAMPLCRALLLPASIAAFIRERPDFSLNVVEGGWRDLVESLRDGVIDLLIGALRTTGVEELKQRPLFVDRPVIVGRVGHPLQGSAAPKAADLARFPWIVGQPGTPLREHWEGLFTAAPSRPLALVECGSVMVARGILRDSDFLTLLSSDQVALEIESGMLATIGPAVTSFVRTIGSISRADWRPTRGQQRFLEILAQQANARRVPDFE